MRNANRRRVPSVIRNARQLHVLTVPKAVESIVRALASVADTNSHKLVRGHTKALHDLRVTIRRIRTVLRAYEESLPSKLSTLRAELAAAMRQTNAHRDLEVHQVMLTQILQRKRLSSRTRDKIHAFRKEMRDQLHHLRSTNQATAQESRLTVREILRVFDQSHPEAVHTLYSVQTASFVQRETNKLVTLGESLERKSQVKRLHRARLSAKRIRYVVEPLLDGVAGVPDGINRLKRLQTLLGDIRDTQTLREAIIANSTNPNARTHGMQIHPVLQVVTASEHRLFAALLRRRNDGAITRLKDRMHQIFERLRT